MAADGSFTVNFASPIENAVVVVTLNTNNDPDATAIRVISSDDNSFTFRYDEFETNTTANHAGETISWIAVTPGEHVLPDGAVIKAGTTTADGSYGAAGVGSNTVLFDTPFAGDPVVLAQATGSNTGDVSEPALATQIRSDAGGNGNNPTTTGFQVRVREQEGNGQNSVADVGWIAISQGTGTNLEAGVQAGIDETEGPDNITFGPITDPVFLAHAQNSPNGPAATDTDGINGNDTFTVRGVGAVGFDSDSASVIIQEDTATDAEVDHNNVNVGFLALGAGQILADPGIVVTAGADPGR